MTAPAVATRPRLPAQQRAIFDALAAREGQAVSFADLNRAIDHSPHACVTHLRVVICYLRKAMRGTGSEIQAVRGEGYRLYRAPGAVFPWEGV